MADDNDDPNATQTASPSTAESTRAGASVPTPGGATQPRDPDRYLIIGEHGRGGLGRVSRAHDLNLGRDVAIKELISRGSLNEIRFLREAFITARLEHPGIVPVHEAGRRPDGTPFYAMKLVAGRPLRDLIAERTTVAERIGLLHHVIAVADAIAYAHGRNIIHRDLKPANVIVGDFGETIVIDWGLAKDLSIAEDSPIAAGPFRANHDIDLTSTGSVLGTPAYMAPEQERGEHVDQRADVFAIGAMLWELCSLQKVPPTEIRLRHRMLRRAGIDQDLVTIIDKSLDPDAMRRYPDAGSLAADLKAFKSGARIAARSYSLLATLSHWIRRHRAVALSVAAAIVLSVSGIALYVRNTTLERDRANTSEEHAKRAQASSDASLDKLTLKHAELLLTSDPSAAVDVLATYRGSDVSLASQVRAEAMALGVALVRAVPHTDNILWTAGDSDGTIISLSTDGTILRTSLDATSVVLSRDVSPIGQLSFSPSRRLLAYACEPLDVCLLDLRHNIRAPIAPMLHNIHVVGISFSPDGMSLALMSKEGVLTIVDVTDPAQPVLRLRKSINGGIDVKFFEANTVAAGTIAGLDFVRVNGDSESLSVPDSSHWDADANLHKFALATTQGQALILEAFPLRIVARNELCHGPIVGLRFIPRGQNVAYACREGAVGIWDPQRKEVTPRVHLEGHADLITVSPTGDYILAGGGHGTVMVLDLHTNLVAFYKGHGFRLTSIAPPSLEHAFIVSADARGAVRAWPLPARFTRIVATSSSRFHTAIFDDKSATVIATTWQPSLTTFSPSIGIAENGPHEAYNIFLEQSSNRSVFATYGFNDIVEIWSAATKKRTHLFSTGQNSVSQLEFVRGTDDFLTSGQDGRLIRWSPSGERTVIANSDIPITNFTTLANRQVTVFSTSEGALWRTDIHGVIQPIRAGNFHVTQLFAFPDEQTIYAGHSNGDVVAIDTSSWRHEIILRDVGAIREIASTDAGGWFAIAADDGTIHVGLRHYDATNLMSVNWTTLAVRARHIALTQDALLIANCTDGAIWFYHIPQRRWVYMPLGVVNLGQVVVSGDGKVAVVLDSEGHLAQIDLNAVRELLDFDEYYTKGKSRN